MVTGAGARFFDKLADLCVRRSGLVLLLVLLATLGGTWSALQLQVSTSRTGLVSKEQPEQAKLERFFERFGRPDAPLVLVTGGTVEERRAAVDALQAAYAREPEFAGRVLGRLGPNEIASLLLLQQPGALAQLRAAVPPGLDLAALIERGSVGWIGAIADRLEASLEDGEQPEGAAAVPMADAMSGLEGLGALATALDDHLAGSNPMDRFADVAGTLGQRGVDDRGYVTTADGEGYLVALYPDLTSDEGAELTPLVGKIRKIRDDAIAPLGTAVKAEVSGMPAFIVDELVVVQDGLSSSTIVATLGIVGICWVLFRSIVYTVLANLPLLPGVVLTLTFVSVTYGKLNLITSSFVAVLLGLGVDFAVHIVSRYNEFLRAGEPRDAAIRKGLVATGPGIVAGAAITAIGFLATATTEFTAYGELGIITAAGLVIVVVTTCTVIPALLSRTTAKAGAVAPEPLGIAAIPGAIRRAKWPLGIGGAAAGVVGMAMLGGVAFNPRYFDFLPQRVESSAPLNRLEYDAIASPVFANLSAPSIEEARAMTAELRATESVAGVQSPSDLVPALDGPALAALRAGFAGLSRDPDFAALAASKPDPDAMAKQVKRVVDALDEVRFAMAQAGVPEGPAVRARAAFDALGKRLAAFDDAGRARLAALDADAAAVLAPAWATARAVAERGYVAPLDLPPLFAKRFAAKDGSAVALYAIPAGKFWERDVAEAFAADIREIDSEASGLALSHVAHGVMIMEGFRAAAVLAAVAIFVVLLIDLRSLKDAALALLPTALGWGWMILGMKAFGLAFDVANIVALPLVLGVGIAYGVHLMHRIREGDPRAGSSAPAERPSIDEAIRGTGGAIAVAAFTTVAGFAALMVPDYGGMRSLGFVMCLGISTCLLATIVVLPAVLLLVGRAR
jgi:predicted RND superfamily exporter protein